MYVKNRVDPSGSTAFMRSQLISIYTVFKSYSILKKLYTQCTYWVHFGLTLCVPMEFPIKFNTVKSGWSIVYIEGSQMIIYFFL